MTDELRVLTTAEAAMILGVRPGTLRKWRARGEGPDWFRLSGAKGGRCSYASTELHRWVTERQGPSRVQP